MRTILMLATALALSGCGRSGIKPADAGNDVAESVNSAAAVAALPRSQREAVLFRAIRDAGLPCQDVVKADEVEAAKGSVTWRAQCEDGALHLIAVKPDGTADVVSRNTP